MPMYYTVILELLSATRPIESICYNHITIIVRQIYVTEYSFTVLLVYMYFLP